LLAWCYFITLTDFAAFERLEAGTFSCRPTTQLNLFSPIYFLITCIYLPKLNNTIQNITRNKEDYGLAQATATATVG
jgi:hypothetical protein